VAAEKDVVAEKWALQFVAASVGKSGKRNSSSGSFRLSWGTSRPLEEKKENAWIVFLQPRRISFLL